MGKTVGVMLSGCGVFDGSEIQEAVFTLLFLDRAGAKALCAAPDAAQMHVFNHLKGEVSPGETRNVLAESARICRSGIRSAKTVKAAELDALVFPGGYGAAKNLSDFAVKGADCTVHPEVARLVGEMLAAGKPVGFVCISPVIAAKVVGDGVELTVGCDADVAGAIAAMGAKHVECSVDRVAIDEKRKIVSVPAYMYDDASPASVAAGIEKLVETVLGLA